MNASATAFDGIARDYDRQFSATQIGRLMRRAVWARCQARFARGSQVLEMNCGTGEDALWLASQGIDVLATDVSPAMLGVAEGKRLRAAGATGAAGWAANGAAGAPATIGSVRFRPLAWEELEALPAQGYDGALSNFGGLNCVADLRGAARGLAGQLRPGAMAVLCVMGPVVPWEWVWFLLHGQPSSAFRRLSGRARWSGIAVHYPSIDKIRRQFAPEFRVLRVSALGALLPPPYVETWIGRYPRALAWLDRMERRFDTVWPLPVLADHYVIELERTA
jgi:SAM-dependent methyltransferase